MEFIKKSWQNFKTQPDVWFFYGFLITFTLTIRKVLSFYPIRGQFNEYTGIYLYLSDIFLVFTLIFWVITILCNKQRELSIYKTLFNASSKPLIFLPLLFVAWSFISVFWSQNTSLALFKSFKLLEFYLLYIYIMHGFSPFRKGGLRGICKIIIILGFIQAIICIIQFALQHSIGLFWLKESLISTDLPGVAKIIFNGHKFIRAYGLFPHPNILGGFLVFSILITLTYKRMFHMEHRSINKSAWNIDIAKILPLFIIILITGLILTFSKSAILGLLVGLAYMFYNNVNLKIISKRYLGQLLKYSLVIALILIFLVILTKPDLQSFFVKSLNERVLYLDVSRETILTNPVTGIGIGQFVLNMQNFKNLDLETWQFQPVHNVFLLIWAELGIVGLFVFIIFLWKLFHPRRNVPRGTFYGVSVEEFKNKYYSEQSVSEIEESIPIRSLDQDRDDNQFESLIYFKPILIAFILIMLFDHYFWDIQQGQIMLWMIMGFIVETGFKPVPTTR
jgi:O-antigen ligase